MEEEQEFDALDDVLDESLDVNRNTTGKIPATLLALCILTIVGSSLILLKNVFSYQIFEEEFFLNKSDVNLAYLVEVIACFGSIAAAIVMIVRKKVGFYIYLISSIAYMLSVIWFWFGVVRIPLNEWLILIILAYVAVPITFIILYSSQKKFLH